MQKASFDYDLAPEAASGENAVQRALRDALRRIARVGHQEFSSAEPNAALLSICGFPNSPAAPSDAHFAAVDLLVSAMARGSGGGEDCAGSTYPEMIDWISTFADAVELCDSRACALLELLHRAAGRPSALPEFPLEVPQVLYEV